MGYPFVPKVLYGLPICSQGSSRVTRLFSKFSQSYKLIVASQCLTLPIIANVKFHWTFPKMRRAGGVADGPRVLCAQQVLFQRHGHHRLHASPPRLELLDASTKDPRLLQRLCPLPTPSRFAEILRKKKRKKNRIPLLKLVFRCNIISPLRVCHFILQLFVHASLKIS